MFAPAKRSEVVLVIGFNFGCELIIAPVARRVGAPLHLDIRDLFTLNICELLTRSPARVLLPLIRLIEIRAFRRAARVNVVSEGFVTHIRSVAPEADIRCFTNGIDDIFLAKEFAKTGLRDDLLLILYAGNMGDGQGLHRIVPQVAKELEGKARLRLIGDGGKRRALEDAITEAGVSNVELLSPVARDQLLGHYRDADIVRLSQLAVLALQGLHPFGHLGRDTSAPAAVALGLLDLAVQRLWRAADLCRDRHHRLPA
jgi:hypothetical protein